jgi:hypothetical protein
MYMEPFSSLILLTIGKASSSTVQVGLYEEWYMNATGPDSI